MASPTPSTPLLNGAQKPFLVTLQCSTTELQQRLSEQNEKIQRIHDQNQELSIRIERYDGSIAEIDRESQKIQRCIRKTESRNYYRLLIITITTIALLALSIIAVLIKKSF